MLALLRDLEEQTLSLASWNVVVVDDGSDVPVAETLDARLPTLNLQHIRTTGVGQSAARKAACALADGEVLVFLDDDMRVGPRLPGEAHLVGACR